MGNYSVPQPGVIANPGVPPTASSVNDNLPVSTAPALIGEVFLPYFLVKDTLPLRTAIRQTPYYRLTRHQFWTKTGQFNFAGPPQTKEYEVVQGLTKAESIAMEDTISLSLTANGGGVLHLAADKASPFEVTIQRSLKVTTTTTTTETTTTTVKRTVQYRGGAEMLFAEYVLVDRYSLFRADGVAVQSPWETKNTDTFRQVVFPPQTAGAIAARSALLSDQS